MEKEEEEEKSICEPTTYSAKASTHHLQRTFNST